MSHDLAVLDTVLTALEIAAIYSWATIEISNSYKPRSKHTAKWFIQISYT